MAIKMDLNKTNPTSSQSNFCMSKSLQMNKWTYGLLPHITEVPYKMLQLQIIKSLTALKGGDCPAGKLMVLKLMRSKSDDILWKGP